MGIFDFGLNKNTTNKTPTEAQKVRWVVEYAYKGQSYRVIDYFPINAVPADARKYVEKRIGTFQFNLLFFYKY